MLESPVTQAPPETMTAAEAVVRSLEKSGAKYVFGMSGHANLALLDALAGSAISFISVPHEQVAVHAADAYYRASHKPGIVLTTLGPGLSNTVGALADAIQDCSAVLILAANVPASHAARDGYQEMANAGLGQTDLLRPVTKQAWRVSYPEQVIPLLTRAYSTCLAPPSGPAMIDLPMDVMSMVGEFQVVDLDARRAQTAAHPDPSSVERAAELLREARRPTIFCGGGALLAEAHEAVRGLAERISAPVATTLIAQGIISNNHPLFAGVSGAVGTRSAHFATANADLVLIVGSRLSDIDANSLNPEYFAQPPRAEIIQVDADPTRIGNELPVSVGIVGDARHTLEAIKAELGDADTFGGDPQWLPAFWEYRDTWQEELHAAQQRSETPPNTESVLMRLRATLPDDVQMVAGIGPRYLVSQHFPVLTPGSHFCASGNGTMGWAVPAALGVKLARPQAPVVCVCGDGELRAVCSSLSTIAEYDIPVIYVVLNNYSYNVIELYQNKYFGRTLGSVFSTPDGELYTPAYAELAESFGVPGLRTDDLDECIEAVKRAADANEPLVVDLDSPRRPRLRASGYWEVNRFLKPGWNLPGNDTSVGGFGDSDSSESPRRSWE